MLWSYGFCSDRSFLHFDTFGDSRTVFCTATISLVVFLLKNGCLTLKTSALCFFD